MYSSFFGFSERPFEVTPDPKYLYSSPSHQETLASLVYGIKERRGFICLTGEVGTGKTMLIHAALDRLDETTKVAYLTNTALGFEQLLLVTLEDLGIVDPGSAVSKMEAIRLLNEFTLRQLSKGGNVVLIIDEAHNLDAESMENLRLLSNLETRKHKLIQIVLSGQPELDEKLGRQDLRQLAQRITVRRVIHPLTEEETYAYVQHRLSVAGYRGSPLFEKEARKMIYEYSGGIPRKINILCDNTLLIGFALEKNKIDGACVAEAARDLKWEPAFVPAGPALPSAAPQVPQLAHKRSSARIALAGSLALAAGLVVGAWATFGRSGSNVPMPPPSFQEPGVQAGIHGERQNGGQPGPESVAVHTEEARVPQQVSVESVAIQKGMTLSSGEGKASEEQEVGGPAAAPLEPEAALIGEVAVMETAKSPSGRTVVVVSNDTLSSIIQRAYGQYNDRFLARVLKENPDIRTPDFILVGQTIKLPELDPKDLNE